MSDNVYPTATLSAVREKLTREVESLNNHYTAQKSRENPRYSTRDYVGDISRSRFRHGFEIVTAIGLLFFVSGLGWYVYSQYEYYYPRGRDKTSQTILPTDTDPYDSPHIRYEVAEISQTP